MKEIEGFSDDEGSLIESLPPDCEHPRIVFPELAAPRVECAVVLTLGVGELAVTSVKDIILTLVVLITAVGFPRPRVRRCSHRPRERVHPCARIQRVGQLCRVSFHRGREARRLGRGCRRKPRPTSASLRGRNCAPCTPPSTSLHRAGVRSVSTPPAKALTGLGSRPMPLFNRVLDRVALEPGAEEGSNVAITRSKGVNNLDRPGFPPVQLHAVVGE